MAGSRPLTLLGIAAVLTISDSRTLENNKFGDTLVVRLEETGHRLTTHAIVPDGKAAIFDTVLDWTVATGMNV